MKRFFAIFAIMFVMFAVMLLFVPQPFCSATGIFPNDAVAVVCCRSTTLPCTNIGNGCLVQCSVRNLTQTLAQCNNVDGVSVRFGGTLQNFDNLLRWFAMQNAKWCYCGDLVVVCGSSSKIRGGVVLGGKVVNIQLAFDGQTVTVGSPLILDSY